MLPIYPLDGGQILQALLWFVIGAGAAWMVSGIFGLVAAGGFIVVETVHLQDTWLAVVAAFVAWQAWRGFRMGLGCKKPDRRSRASTKGWPHSATANTTKRPPTSPRRSRRPRSPVWRRRPSRTAASPRAGVAIGSKRSTTTAKRQPAAQTARRAQQPGVDPGDLPDRSIPQRTRGPQPRDPSLRSNPMAQPDMPGDAGRRLRRSRRLHPGPNLQDRANADPKYWQKFGPSALERMRLYERGLPYRLPFPGRLRRASHTLAVFPCSRFFPNAPLPSRGDRKILPSGTAKCNLKGGPSFRQAFADAMSADQFVIGPPVFGLLVFVLFVFETLRRSLSCRVVSSPRRKFATSLPRRLPTHTESSETFEDGERHTRSLLPSVADVRPNDKLQGGVALKATEREICLHPYLFRLVCKNGAIRAHAIQTRRIDLSDVLLPEIAAESLREAVNACCTKEAFAEGVEEGAMQLAQRSRSGSRNDSDAGTNAAGVEPRRRSSDPLSLVGRVRPLAIRPDERRHVGRPRNEGPRLRRAWKSWEAEFRSTVRPAPRPRRTSRRSTNGKSTRIERIVRRWEAGPPFKPSGRGDCRRKELERRISWDRLAACPTRIARDVAAQTGGWLALRCHAATDRKRRRERRSRVRRRADSRRTPGWRRSRPASKRCAPRRDSADRCPSIERAGRRRSPET